MGQTYLTKTDPYAHQPIGLDEAFGRRGFAYLMEQGTGKSWMAIVEASTLWAMGRISAMVVVAPNDVHRQWVTQQIPEHCAVPHRTAYWAASFRVAEKESWEHLWAPVRDLAELRIFVFNVEAFQRAGSRAAKEMRKVLNAFDVYLAIDESSRIKTPGTTRTKVLTALGKHATYRRILTGTPLENTPMDAYAQFRFLDPQIMGFSSYSAFKHHFAKWEKRRTSNNRRGWYEELVEYRNMDELRRKIAANSFRVRKDGCLDLPPKVYETRTVALTRDQRRMYDALVEEGVARLGGPRLTGGTDRDDALWALLMDEDGLIRGQMALTLLLRLQQVVGGWVTDEAGAVHAVPGGNPKLEGLLRYTDELEGQVIVWARFVPEILAIAEALRGRGEQVVEYHGGVKTEDRAKARHLFQEEPSVRWFVGNPHAGGLGLNLTAASTVIYYSNDFSYGTRAQSEDRAHRIGQMRSVLYVDFVAEGTVDEKVVGALRNKQQMAEDILDGDADGDDKVHERLRGGGEARRGGAGKAARTAQGFEETDAGRGHRAGGQSSPVRELSHDRKAGIHPADRGDDGRGDRAARKAQLMNGSVELSGEYLHQTENGIKVDFEGDGEGVWLPKSQIIDMTLSCRRGDVDPLTLTFGDLIEVELPEWLAIEKGLV